MFNILAHQPNDLGIQIGPVAPVILGMLLAPDLTSTCDKYLAVENL